jgi:uncharacterized protein with FMN-binding domain
MKNLPAAVLVLTVAALLAGCKGSPKPYTLSMPDLAGIADGVYQGEAKQFPVLVQVEVTVAGGKITAFEILKHRNGRGRSAEVLADEVVARQTIEIDAVSGATYSSMAILKAGENALRSGLAP